MFDIICGIFFESKYSGQNLKDKNFFFLKWAIDWEKNTQKLFWKFVFKHVNFKYSELESAANVYD